MTDPGDRHAPVSVIAMGETRTGLAEAPHAQLLGIGWHFGRLAIAVVVQLGHDAAPGGR
jgi:hypothetical protein